MTETRRKFEGLRDAVDRDLRAQWTAWDNGDEAARHAAQKAMIALLDRRRYLSNLIRDVTGDTPTASVLRASSRNAADATGTFRFVIFSAKRRVSGAQSKDLHLLFEGCDGCPRSRF